MAAPQHRPGVGIVYFHISLSTADIMSAGVVYMVKCVDTYRGTMCSLEAVRYNGAISIAPRSSGTLL